VTQFTDLGLSKKILDAVSQEGYTEPTPIQAQSIPALLAGKDLLGIAQTGTGKTAAFALPILERLSQHQERVAKGHVRALILSPTRELAAQIGDSFKTYGKYMKLSRAVVFGGVNINRQIELCRGGLDILVATPGRLVDLIERRAISLSKVEIFVLDEVDQMLDLGFIHAIRRIVSLLPHKRQNLFFSATMPKEIAGLAAGLLTDPVRVEITPVATTAERVNQSVIHVEAKKKIEVLNDLLKDNNMTRTLVFTKTKHGADKVVRGLEKATYTAVAIHGNKSQANRERALAGFKQGKILVLVATDIAARGIDVEAVSHVVNYDLPHVPESYVHRIGRTARAGAGGEAIAFCAPEERPLLRDIEKTIRQKVPVREHALGMLVVDEPMRRGKAKSLPPSHPRPEREPRAERPARPMRSEVKVESPAPITMEEVQRTVDAESLATAKKRSDWNPMQNEDVVMYEKPKAPERIEGEVRDNKPWFKKKSGFNTFDGGPRRGDRNDRSQGARKPFRAKSEGFKDSPRDAQRPEGGERKPWSNDRPRGDFKPREARGDFKPRGERPERKPWSNDRPAGEFKPREERGEFKPRGDRPERKPWSNDRPRGDFKPREDRGEFRPRGERPTGERKPWSNDRPAGEFRPRAERSDGAPQGERREHGTRDFKPRGDKPFKPKSFGMKGGERSEGGPRKSFGFKGKPSGGFGAKKFAGSKPGGFSKPSGGNFKRKNADG
jgi:ATP-dependent RNA helicase RhlE